MNNLLFGILTVSFCTIAYFYSWKFQANDNYKIALVLLILCGLVLRIYTSADFFLHPWDERYHALVAKNLIQHPLTPKLYSNPVLPFDYKNWGSNNIWLHKQPLPLWTMAFSMWIFGINEIALRLPSIILTTIGIWLIFSIASYFFNKKVAYLSAFLYSINGLIIELTGGRVTTDHIDIFFLFFIELAVFFSITFARKQNMIYNILAGVSIGAAVLSKWLPALIVLPIWLLIVIDSGNFKIKNIVLNFFILVATCILIFLPWQLYIFKTFPAEANWESGLTFRHFGEVFENHSGPFYYFIDRIRINYGDLVYLPLLWFSWKTLKKYKDYKRMAIFIWFIIPFLFFSFAKTKMQAYILFTCPALFMMTSDFWQMLSDYKKNHKLRWLFNLILFLLIALPVRYTIERTKPFEKADRNPLWVTDLKKLNKKNFINGVLLNYEKPVEAMFYTNLTAYPQIPAKQVILDLVSQGHAVIINDNGNIPAEITAISGVITEKLSSSSGSASDPLQ